MASPFIANPLMTEYYIHNLKNGSNVIGGRIDDIILFALLPIFTYSLPVLNLIITSLSAHGV